MCLLDTLRASIALRTASWLNEKLGPLYLESCCKAQIAGDAVGTETLRDLQHIRSFVATQGMAAIYDAPWVPIFVVFIWILHPYLGMVALTSAIVLLAISLVTEYLTLDPNEAAEETSIELMRLADVTVRNAEVVQAMGMMPAMADRWKKLSKIETDATHAASDLSSRLLTLSKFLRAFVQIAILGVGAYLVVENQITPGAMIAAAIMLGRALSPVELAIAMWSSFIATRLAYHRLKEHIKTYPPEAPRTELSEPDGYMLVRGVSFDAPEGGPRILKDVSFDILPGEVLAIVGPSGAGKSTLCRLLVGLNRPATGRILLDGSDLHHWDRNQLGRALGYLPQEVELFPGTVRENIARMAVAPDKQVLAAAERAQVHDLIQRLPHGYDTVVGWGGVRLSGGQRQRVGLARAVFGRPCLVVLDEPNANLDQTGEIGLAEALKDLKRTGTAVVVVGHRPSTLAQADKLLVLQDGRVAHFGRRDDVMKAWSETAASEGGDDTVPIHRPITQKSQKLIEYSSAGDL
jgi:ATP-binding cassette subfamily C protein/ATP-binding cassette subfamily C exporter for protease/lipase/ATP-binding cassette subfamily C protein EexD